MTEKESIFQNLQQMADAVAALFGKNCEACVHDLTDLHNSLIYIQGEVTHRKPGAPATDLLLKMLKSNGGRGEDMHNYKTTTTDGRSLKSTTTFIRDSKGTAIAAFCINFDTTEFYNASLALLPFASITENDHPHNIETFANSVSETVDALFEQAISEIGKHPATMNVEEKTQLIQLLEEHGTFQFKGAVEQVAFLMGVTKFTVYNYLKKVRTIPSPPKNESKERIIQ